MWSSLIQEAMDKLSSLKTITKAKRKQALDFYHQASAYIYEEQDLQKLKEYYKFLRDKNIIM